MFARYDVDGDRVLDEEEQRRMQADLFEQKVGWIWEAVRQLKNKIYLEIILYLSKSKRVLLWWFIAGTSWICWFFGVYFVCIFRHIA